MSHKYPMFFIFGCGRSGTTLLAALLSANPDIYVLNDSFVFDIFAGAYFSTRDRRVRISGQVKSGIKKFNVLYELNRKLKRMTVYRHWVSGFIPKTSGLPGPDHCVDIEIQRLFLVNLMRRYRSAQVRNSKNSWQTKYADKIEFILSRLDGNAGGAPLNHLFYSIFDHLTPKEYSGRSVMGEKTPVHLYYSGWIHTVFPKSKRIILIRNPFSNIASIYRRNNDLKASANEYLSYFHPGQRPLFDDPGSLLIRYEDLLNSPEKTLSCILRFLDLPVKEIATEFNYYIKEYYVGNHIDPSRDKVLIGLLDRRRKKYIKKKCKHIFARFYPDFPSLYPELHV